MPIFFKKKKKNTSVREVVKEVTKWRIAPLKLDLKVSDFNISGEPIPEDICDKIVTFHILPLQSVRNHVQFELKVSDNSGYRSVAWEISKGRSGNSQHTFKDKGAVDLTCDDFDNNKNKLLNALIEFSNYTRIAMYNSFIHCDYKETASGKREFYNSNSASEWDFVKYV